ncbi:TonB-dependent siderophore receptor [Neorhizobium alkalisoli]|uniref:Iron complex outermembrane receptor protein n=1 Tax=Neorhizobium alkalisoli TaxID=528178 RepID=A0A561R8T7_9HYPH|nr:TonB-dependent siderophore receptor [Neorhizobium alkalisoli]TWF59045.1 iron complex outermembrane receptor protein [Neorhizobium alkalisoli]
MSVIKRRLLGTSSLFATVVLAGLATAATAQAQTATTNANQTATETGASDTTLAPIILSGSGDSDTTGYQPVSNSSATRSNLPLLDIPQAVNIVSDKVIEDQAAKTLDDVLNNVSSINQANTLGGTQDAVMRRGFGEKIDGSVLTDGLRTVLPRSVNATTDRVEVLKGPSSALYGIQEPGGVINVITKKPQEKFGGSITATGSSFGGGSTQLDVTGPIEGTDFAYRLIGSYEDVDYWRNYGKTKQWLIAPSLSWTGEDTKVNVAYTHRDYLLPFDRGQIFDETTGKPVTTDPKTQFTERYNITDGRSDLFSVNVEHDLSDDWKVRFDYNYSQDVYSDNQARIMSYDPATGNLTRRADSTNDSTQKQHAVRMDLQGDVDIAGFRNDLLIGANYTDYDLLRSDMIRCSAVGGFNIYNPVYGTLPKCTTVAAKDSDQTIQQKSLTAYVQDAVHLNDQWILIGGLTLQHYDQYAGKGRPFIVATDAEGFEVTPRAGIVYKVTPDVSLYATYASSFMPQSSIADVIGELPPETGKSYEVGAKFELLGGLTATTAFYHIDKRNVLYNETINNADGTTTSISNTSGKVMSQGFEFDIAGALTDNLSMIASYSYNNNEVVEDAQYQGNNLANVARHTGSLYLTYDFGEVFGTDNTLKIGGGLRGRSKAPGNYGNDYYLPGYVAADAFATYTIQTERPIAVQLNLKNLFNKTYYTSSLYTAGAYLGNQIGNPFEASLSVKMSF